MKNFPIGIQTFSEVIRGNYLYVDKTREIYKLFEKGGKYYFFSRPRRFGKSLLISTLKEIFSGNKELFKEQWIYDQIKWEKYPVLHIDFLKTSNKTPEMLEESISIMLDNMAASQGITLAQNSNYKEKFSELLETLGQKRQVVVLIDEYDKPIIDKIDHKELAAANRDVLKEFYSVLKSADQYIKFAFLTGVSKFSRVSVFSGLNNLDDITLDSKFSTMLGYTHQELKHYFQEGIDTMTQLTQMEENDLLSEIKAWYNGYSWDGENFLYNPFSILNLFSKEKFDNYWVSTGTPTFLIKLLKDQQIDITGFEGKPVDNTVFESYDIDNMSIAPLLFQTGYLTIKEVRKIHLRHQYVLSYPNEEVKETFLKYFLAGITETPVSDMGSLILDMAQHIINNQIDAFFSVLRTIFSGIPYNIFISDRESYYHTVIYLVLSLVGVSIKAEVQTHSGRIDAVLETGTHIYVMEFKLGDAKSAMAQIKEKDYAAPYRFSNKQIVLIGLGFDTTKKNLGDYIIEILPTT